MNGTFTHTHTAHTHSFVEMKLEIRISSEHKWEASALLIKVKKTNDVRFTRKLLLFMLYAKPLVVTSLAQNLERLSEIENNGRVAHGFVLEFKHLLYTITIITITDTISRFSFFVFVLGSDR